MLCLPVLVGRHMFLRNSCTRSHVSASMIAGCVSGEIFRCSGGLLMIFLDLYDFFVVLKLQVHPVYSRRSRIFDTVCVSHPQGSAETRCFSSPCVSRYAVGQHLRRSQLLCNLHRSQAGNAETENLTHDCGGFQVNSQPCLLPV